MELNMKNLSASLWLRVLISFECIFLLSGCNKIIDWGKSNFAQAPVYAQDFVKAAQTYLRSTLVYSQFTTVANFDAIFLTDQMRMLYIDYHKKCHGLSAEQESLMRTRMLNENKYFISFYVIAAQKEHLYNSRKALFTGTYQKQTDVLGSKYASWAISMIVDKKEYIPESIRIVDLPMEYRNFFGDRLSQFNSTYLVRFAVKDPQGDPIFESFKKYKVLLKFTSSDYQVDLIWKNMMYSKG